MCDQIEILKEKINQFVEERDWDQFHTPKNLTMALSVEVAELMEHFLWADGADSVQVLESKADEIRQELADVFIYVLRLSDVCGIDLLGSVEEKLELNHKKFPEDVVKGSSKKYTEY